MSDFFVVALVLDAYGREALKGGNDVKVDLSIYFSVGRADGEWRFRGFRLVGFDWLVAFHSIEICWRRREVTGL